MTGKSTKTFPYCLIAVVVVITLSDHCQAEDKDKSGVSANTISLPTGPGSIEGLGESFKPMLNTGMARYTVGIKVPPGVNGHTPVLSLTYDSGLGDGPVGIGWTMGPGSISRQTDKGIPRYVDSANGVYDDQDGETDEVDELDTFIDPEKEELVPLADGYFRAKIERDFIRYQRLGNSWVAQLKNGTSVEYGITASGRVSDQGGTKTYRWLLEKSTDTNGNVIEYSYTDFTESPIQRYLKEVRYGPGDGPWGVYYFVYFSYEDRPDWRKDYRSGFLIKTTKRLQQIDVGIQGTLPPDCTVGDWNADGTPDALIRRYVISYEGGIMGGAPCSYLSAIAQYGADSTSTLPPISFSYAIFDPNSTVSAAGSVMGSVNTPINIMDSELVEIVDLNSDSLPDILKTDQGGDSHIGYLNLGPQGEHPDQAIAWSNGCEVTSIDGFATQLDLSSDRVHLADMDGDGRADLVYTTPWNEVAYHLNGGDMTWRERTVMSIQDTAPPAPFTNEDVKISDFDFDKRIDVIRSTPNGYAVWFNRGGGKYSREVRTAGAVYQGQVIQFSQTAVHLADINGDRLNDVVWVRPTEVIYCANKGHGSFDPNVSMPIPDQVLTSGPNGQVEKARLEDINGDGMADLVVERATISELWYWLNLGTDEFSAKHVITDMPAVYHQDTVTRWADMNGNGTTDLIYAAPIEPKLRVLDIGELVGGSDHANLLTGIDNGLGAVTTIEYSSSTQLYLDDQRIGDSWQTTLPFPVQVVTAVNTEVAALVGRERYEETFDYWSGYYDEIEKEFWGFSREHTITMGDSTAPTVHTTSWFHTGQTDESLKGKLAALETVGAGGTLFLRAENSWLPRVLAAGIDARNVTFAHNDITNKFIHEGTNSPVKQHTTFAYDDYGNTLEEFRYGIVDPNAPVDDPNGLSLGSDEQLISREFIYDTANWILNRQKSEEIRNLDGVLQARSRFYYDGLPWGQLSVGNLTLQEDWLDTRDEYVPTLTNDYDSYGNIIRNTNANGHFRTIGYDSSLHVYPISETIHLKQDPNLVMTAGFHYGYGTVADAIDFAGAQLTFDYDPFGRLISIHKPGGVVTAFAYHLASPVNHILTQTSEDASGGTYDSYAYFDGLGRKLGAKVEAEAGQWRFLEATCFNQRRREQKRWLPYFTPTRDYETPDPNLPYLSLEYDVLDRVIRTINPDDTYSRTVYEPLVQHLYDEKDNAGSDTPKSLRYDGLERLVEVTERNDNETPYVTSYVWSTLGGLVQITDAQANAKTFSYDSLRRKTGMNDCDRGHMNYAYDDVGNLIRTTDAKGQVIEYTYDSAERIKTENYHDQGGGAADPNDVIYFYDLPSVAVDFGDGSSGTASFTGGRLAAVIDCSGEEHFSYDARGNLAWTVKRIDDPQAGELVSYKMGFDYDRMDRVTDIYYPDNDHARYIYNEASFVERIDGDPNGRVILSQIGYEPTGQLKEIHYGNGVTTAYNYDNRDRLENLLTATARATELIHYAYHYDPVSNITRIIDHRPFTTVPTDSARRNTQVFQYDDLYRLTQVRYARKDDLNANHGQIDYSYDAIGNMLGKSSPDPGQPGHIDDDQYVNLGAMNYAGGRSGRIGREPNDLPGPHALTATANGGVYEYDDNGNMIQIDGAACSWDYKDRLVRYEKDDTVAEYTYDYTNRRITKLVTQDGQTTQTLYPNRAFEIRPNQAPTKYVFNGAIRVARIKGTLDPDRDRVQRIWLNEGMNLICLAVQTDQNLEEIFGSDTSAYSWNGMSYDTLDGSAVWAVGQPVWLQVPSSQVVVAKGLYNPNLQDIPIPAGESLQGWPRLEPFTPAVHVEGLVRLDAYDAYDTKWLLRDPKLPEFLSNMPDELPSASGFWCKTDAQANLTSYATGAQDILFYHSDHLGSSNVITDLDGEIVQETANYPFGHPRHEFIADPNSPFRADYKFTGKEKDMETGLQYFEARYLNDTTGRFLVTDPIYEDVERYGRFPENDEAYQNFVSFYGRPQKLNPYAYVLNNPIHFIDPTGFQEEKEREEYKAGRQERLPSQEEEMDTYERRVLRILWIETTDSQEDEKSSDWGWITTTGRSKSAKTKIKAKRVIVQQTRLREAKRSKEKKDWEKNLEKFDKSVSSLKGDERKAGKGKEKLERRATIAPVSSESNHPPVELQLQRLKTF
jgi:RHS repeat-associated protein